MTVVPVNKAYDDPSYRTRQVDTGGICAAGTLTPAGHIFAAQKLNLYQVVGYLTAAGTVGTANIDAIKVEGTTTTTMATNNIGTTAIKGTFSIDLTTSGVAPTTLAAGGYAYCVNRLDATVASIIGWEKSLAPDGVMAKPA